MPPLPVPNAVMVVPLLTPEPLSVCPTVSVPDVIAVTVMVLPLMLPVTTAPVVPEIANAELIVAAAAENDVAADRLMLPAVLTLPSIVTFSDPDRLCSVVSDMLATLPPRNQAPTGVVLYCQNTSDPGLTLLLSKPRKYTFPSPVSGASGPKYWLTVVDDGNDTAVPIGTRVDVVKIRPLRSSALPPADRTDGVTDTICVADILPDIGNPAAVGRVPGGQAKMRYGG